MPYFDASRVKVVSRNPASLTLNIGDKLSELLDKAQRNQKKGLSNAHNLVTIGASQVLLGLTNTFILSRSCSRFTCSSLRRAT